MWSSPLGLRKVCVAYVLTTIVTARDHVQLDDGKQKRQEAWVPPPHANCPYIDPYHPECQNGGPPPIPEPTTRVTITGEDGGVITYAPTQDPDLTQETGTVTVTVTGSDGKPTVRPAGPGGWYWEIVGDPPDPALPPPPPPSTPPQSQSPGDDNDEQNDDEEDDQEDDQIDHVTVTGDDNSVITYAPSQNTDYLEETGTVTSTSTRDDGEIVPIIIGPGGWFRDTFGPPRGPGPLPPPPTTPPPPPGSNEPGNPPGEDTDDEENEEEEEEEEETTSCTTTITATYASVFCSVVSGEDRPEDCVTRVYDTSTACEKI